MIHLKPAAVGLEQAAAFVSLSESVVLRLVREGTFPKPRQLSGRRVACRSILNAPRKRKSRHPKGQAVRAGCPARRQLATSLIRVKPGHLGTAGRRRWQKLV